MGQTIVRASLRKENGILSTTVNSPTTPAYFLLSLILLLPSYTCHGYIDVLLLGLLLTGELLTEIQIHTEAALPHSLTLK